MNSFYQRIGQDYAPTEFAVSPWTGRSQNGVALAGLTAHLLNAVPTPVPMLTARLTLDILGTVPLLKLSPSIRTLREGRNLQLIEIELQADGRCWVRATALRMRTTPTPVRVVPMSWTFPEQSVPRQNKLVEAIPLTGGDFIGAGPGTTWVRFVCAVVAGETLTPLESAAMLADFGAGVGPILSPKDWTFANVDISLYLTRPPLGEWLLIDSASESAGNGVGIANSRLADRDGLFGSAHQTTFLQPRESGR
jgi:hypothetical protein